MKQAKRGRPAKKKTAPPMVDGDRLVLDAIGGPDPAARSGAAPEAEVSPSVDLPPLGAAEAEAAARLEAEAGPKAQAPPGGSQAPEEGFLSPGVISGWLLAVNDRLVEEKSLWAASKKEAQQIGAALEKVLDKWFPSVGSWSPEATLAFMMFLYLTPRLPAYVRAKRADKVLSSPRKDTASASPSASAIGDSRLAS